jgi:hypothetical protein
MVLLLISDVSHPDCPLGFRNHEDKYDDSGQTPYTLT